MVRIGWLKDNPGFVGGSEISWATLLEHAPNDIEMVYCPPNKRPPGDVEAFIVQNCVQYDARWVHELALKPVIKHIRDPWAVGDAVLRRWLLENSQLLIFNSQPAMDFFGYDFTAPATLMPPPVDVDKFAKYALPQSERDTNLFVGRVGPTKGAHLAIDWALRTGERLDLIGDRVGHSYGRLPSNIHFHGFVDYEQLPAWYGRAKRLLMFPLWIESFGRVVAEAHAAGCKLLVDPPERVGAMWWIAHYPDKLGAGIEMFWDTARAELHL